MQTNATGFMQMVADVVAGASGIWECGLSGKIII